MGAGAFFALSRSAKKSAKKAKAPSAKEKKPVTELKDARHGGAARVLRKMDSTVC